MIVTNFNDFVYAFEPNIVEVECELGSETKEVTVSGNGITLKRNSYYHKCRFDLSVILESKFADTEFIPNYSAVEPDRAYAEQEITISTADEADIVKIVKIHWGAYQFDEINSNADFSFPFWVGMPLVVNSSKNYDHWYLLSANQLDNDGVGVQTINIPNTTTEQFTHEVKLLGTKVQKITYIPQTCPVGHYLQWLDSHGQIWHYMFYASREKQIATEIKTGESVPYYPFSINDSNNGLSKVLSKTKQRSFGCYQSVTEEIYHIVESVLSSPIVRYWINNKWVGVNIKDNTVSPSKRGFIDIEFIVELPTDFIQTR